MRRHCPQCGHHWAWHLSDGRFKCRRCTQRYSWRSVWQSVRLSEPVKRQLLELFVFGVPAYRLRFRGPASRAASERFFRTVRRVLLRADAAEQQHEPLSGSIECDETMFGGYRPGKRGWGASGKVIVLGLLKRNGLVRVFIVPSRGRQELLKVIQEHTSLGSLYYTDDWQAYGTLAVRGGHVVVRKEKGRPKGRDHINGIEGFWSYAKHWLYHYRGVPRKFLPEYLAELSYRFNHRDCDLYPLIEAVLKATPASEIT
jgi:transposase